MKLDLSKIPDGPGNEVLARLSTLITKKDPNPVYRVLPLCPKCNVIHHEGRVCAPVVEEEA